mgnify:CR=1 FL=1
MAQMALACSGVISCVPRKNVLAYSLVTSPHLEESSEDRRTAVGEIGAGGGAAYNTQHLASWLVTLMQAVDARAAVV